MALVMRPVGTPSLLHIPAAQTACRHHCPRRRPTRHQKIDAQLSVIQRQAAEQMAR
jgi:hypothetical protein